MSAHLLYVGGEDHHLRIPFMLAMREHGFRVTAVGSGDAAPFNHAGLDFRRYHFNRYISPLSDWATLKELAKIIEDVNPDLAQGYDTKPCLFVPLASRLVGFPGAIRTICGRGWVYSSTSLLALAARPVYRLLHRTASFSTAATVFEMDEDRDFFERYRMTGQTGIAIPAGGGGVDVEGFERALACSRSAGQVRKELGLGDSKVVITVTRMTRQKGIPTLLKAAAIVERMRPDVKFLLVGPRESEGPLAVTKAELERHSPYVKAVGPRSDIPALLNIADVFAFPTEYREGVPRVLLEASLAQVPIVSTNMPGCCEVVHQGSTGFLVPPFAPEALAQRILEMLDNREAAKSMAARAGELVRHKFSLTSIAARHAALYSAILNSRHSSAPHLTVEQPL